MSNNRTTGQVAFETFANRASGDATWDNLPRIIKEAWQETADEVLKFAVINVVGHLTPEQRKDLYRKASQVEEVSGGPSEEEELDLHGEEDLEQMILNTLKGGPLHMSDIIDQLGGYNSNGYATRAKIKSTTLPLIIMGRVELTPDRRLALPRKQK
jgi:hypothetical protein